ncbi:hypothetical protein AB0M95_37090 [Sphaerisporangium sp. NPDC051017]
MKIITDTLRAGELVDEVEAGAYSPTAPPLPRGHPAEPPPVAR